MIITSMKLEILSSSTVLVTRPGHAPTNMPVSSMIDKLPSEFAALVSRPIRPYDKAVNCSSIWHYLLPHQREGVQRIVHQFNGRCLLADEMGLGKTLQAVAVILHYNVTTLVVCPAFLQSAWHNALEQWSACAVVVTFDTVPADTSFDLIVVDEAHYIKTRDAQRTQVVLPYILRARYALLMSGTPCPNRPEELFTLMHGLRPQIIPSFVFFANRYCKPRRTRFCAFDTKGSDRPRELAWLLARAFQVRRTKKEVLPQLPPKCEKVWYVDIDEAARQELIPLRKKVDRAMENGSRLAQTMIMEMYRSTARAKLDQAVKAAVDIIHGPALVFAHHRIMLDAMQEALGDKSVARIDGSVSLSKRQQIVDQFQQGDIEVIVLSIGAAGVGLTLTASSTAIFLEIPWSPAALRQCEDRVHRIGQLNKCTIHYILANDTLDKHVWSTIHRKEGVSSKIGFGS